MSSPTDEELLADHLRGHPNAFRVLVDRHHLELHRFVLRFTGSSAAAEDVVQDSFIQVHIAAASFDPQRKLKPWLFTIAANKARDYLRRRTRRREVPLDAPVDGDSDSDGLRFFALMADQGPTPLETLQEAEKGAIVRKTVDQLPAPLREVLVLAYFHHFPYKEMAEILDIPLGTVKSRLHSAVSQFGKLFREGQNPQGQHDV
ncbi:MAG: RNA polymerase sigma factor [Phycisphaerae bacterium]|nr:RNA polymerase sigma factor [Phycisphaerae bacterium]